MNLLLYIVLHCFTLFYIVLHCFTFYYPIGISQSVSHDLVPAEATATCTNLSGISAPESAESKWGVDKVSHGHPSTRQEATDELRKWKGESAKSEAR